MTNKKKKQYKFDIFDAFARINKEQYEFFNHLTEEQMKEFQPYVLMRWMKGAKQNNEVHTILTNEYMNPYVFALQKHPVLLYKLAVAANGGIDEGRYTFSRKPTHKSQNKTIETIMMYYNCNADEAYDRLQLLDQESLEEISESLGLE